ncbi:MAG: hypothetical protein J6T10_06970 [Methanobrevibacter sp.]|nr:hypothetical protein [Methanobrevibacter sp.]
MATGNFYGKSPLLNANEIFTTIYNMIISQRVFSDNIKGTYGTLVDKFRVDGTLYGDTKLYYATDCLESSPWTGDSEAANLLALNRPDDPKVQYVTIDQFRKIWTTIDNYLTKRAWSTEGAFSSFNSVMLGWMGETKRIYDSRLINVFVGNTTSNATKGTITINLDEASSGDPLYGLTGEEKNRVEASIIARDIADLLVDLKDTTRDYNDYKFIRSYATDDLIFVWNSAWVNKIKKIDLPTIFHKDGLMEKMDEYILPAKYFGRAVAASDKGSGKVINGSNEYDPTKGTIRSKVEKTVTVSGTDYHLFPGDELPSGATVGTSQQFTDVEVYIVDSTIMCKAIHKDAVPFMSAFTTNTVWWNPRALNENHYLIWGYSEPCYLYNYPFLTIKKK